MPKPTPLFEYKNIYVVSRETDIPHQTIRVLCVYCGFPIRLGGDFYLPVTGARRSRFENLLKQFIGSFPPEAA